MKKVMILFIVSVLFGCTKEEKDAFVRAGIIGKKDNLYLTEFHEFMNVDSVFIPPYYSATYAEVPVDLNNDSDIDIKLGYAYSFQSDKAFQKNFHLAENLTDFEFAADVKDTIICGDTLQFVKILQYNDLIDGSLKWVKGMPLFISYFQRYYCEPEVSIKKNISEGYIGVRKIRATDIFYGWIKIDVINLEHIYLREFLIQ